MKDIENKIPSIINPSKLTDKGRFSLLSSMIDSINTSDKKQNTIKDVISMVKSGNFPDYLEPETLEFIKEHSMDIFCETGENSWTIDKNKSFFHLENKTKGFNFLFMRLLSDAEGARADNTTQYIIDWKRIEECSNDVKCDENRFCELIKKGLDKLLEDNQYLHGWLYANKVGMGDFADISGGKSKILEMIEDKFNEVFEIGKTNSSINYDVLSKLNENDNTYKRSELYLVLYYHLADKTPFLSDIVKVKKERMN